VKEKGTFAQALQNECMDVWNVSVGNYYPQTLITLTKIFTVVDMIAFDTQYNASNVPRHLKVSGDKCFHFTQI